MNEDVSKSTCADHDHSFNYSACIYEKNYLEIIAVEPGLEPLIQDISRIPPARSGEINHLELQDLVENPEAAERMIEIFLKHAVRIAWVEAQKYETDIEPILYGAFVGLINATRVYFWGSFKSHAYKYIRQNIREEICKHNYFPDSFARPHGLYVSIYPYLKRYGCTKCEELRLCSKARNLILEKSAASEKKLMTLLWPLILRLCRMT